MPLYNNPALGQAFGNLAKIFAPPSGSELAGYATAAAKRQEAQRLAELYSYAAAPNFDQSTFDRLGQATGQWTPSTGYYGVDVNAATSRSNNAADNARALEDRRLQEAAAMARLGITNQTERDKFAADNARALDQTRLEQEGALAKLFATPITVGEGQTTYLPQQTQTATGLGPTLGGAIKLNPGEQATLPGGATLSGAPKPLTEAEVQGGILAGLPQADQRAKVLGDIPVETIIMGGQPQIVRRNDAVGMEPYIKPDAPVKPDVKNYRTPDGKMGTAVPSPDGKLLDTQTGQEIPAGSVTIGVNVQAANPEQALGISAMRDAKNAVVNDDIGRALDIIATNPTLSTGIVGQVSGGIGGTPAKSLAALLDTVKANVGFDQLQAMRNASPTGGALGQVSDTENRLLQSVLGSLDISQPPATLEYNLRRLANTVNDIVHGAGKGPERYDLGTPGAAGATGAAAPGAPQDDPTKAPGFNAPVPQTQQEFDAIPPGALYRDPDDGKLYRK